MSGRRLSKHLTALTFALVAARLGIGCEEDGLNVPRLDLSLDSSVNLPPSGDGSVPAVDGGGGDDAADADVDAGPAVVVTTAPLDRRVGVGTGSKITVTFGTPMQAGTVTVQPASGACTGSVQILEGPTFTTCLGATKTTADNVVFTFTPSANLENELRYKVSVSADALAADGRPVMAYAMTTGFLTQKFAADAKVLYMATPTTGNLGGVAGADNACSTKATRPVGVVAAKAMITAATRTACSVANCGTGNTQLDWVLRPNQHYVREDGAYVFLTDGNGIFTAYPGDHDLGSGVNFWDGLNENWTTRGPNCTNWTSTADTGAVGFDVVLNVRWLTGGMLPCGLARPFICAEQ
jgi:Protein of unknown function (DUF1554)/Bacterial Ig-like domain